jgi:exopolysaccharide biosynthesis protein
MLIVGKHSVNQLKEYGVQEAVSFGPPLLVNGKSTITRGDGGWGIAPRTAIGQTEDGRVLLLAIDGRNLHSVGATLRDVQDVLKKYGAVNAANLDGGSSTTMVLNGSIINKPSDVLGERAVSTAFLVIPAKEGDN